MRCPQTSCLATGSDRPEVDAGYQACSNFLRSIGIENRAELARILDIATNPNSLFHTYRDDKRDSNPLVGCYTPSCLVLPDALLEGIEPEHFTSELPVGPRSAGFLNHALRRLGSWM